MLDSVQTFLERDLQVLRAVENLAGVRRLMTAACLRIGNLLNQSELCRDTGIVQPQVHRFLNLLEGSYQAVRVPGYAIPVKAVAEVIRVELLDDELELHASFTEIDVKAELAIARYVESRMKLSATEP